MLGILLGGGELACKSERENRHEKSVNNSSNFSR